MHHADDAYGRVVWIGLVDGAGCSPRYKVSVIFGLKHIILALDHLLITLWYAKLGDLELLQILLIYYGIWLLM